MIIDWQYPSQRHVGGRLPAFVWAGITQPTDQLCFSSVQIKPAVKSLSVEIKPLIKGDVQLGCD